MSEKRFRNDQDRATRSQAQREEARNAPVPDLSPIAWLNSIEPRPVQAKEGTPTAPDATVQAVASAGVQGSGERLPHLDAIQASFGEHDVSSVRAHVGGAAEDAARTIGATAYATGNDVALPASPDLHTVAHEAAHSVQQRAGVHPKGDVGRAGDPYEQHADAVADRVVAGQPAGDLLDTMAPTSRASSVGAGTVVQRKDLASLHDNTEGRGLAHLRGKQPSAAQPVDAFPPLPAWAGLKVEELALSDLLSALTEAPLTGEIPANKVAELSRDWKQHLEGGSSTRQVTIGSRTIALTAGYRNAVARGKNTYYADLSWRITVVGGDSGEGDPVREEFSHVIDRGRIVFSTTGPVDIAEGPSSRKPDAFALDPTDSNDRTTGAISCAPGDAPDPNDPTCFLRADERAKLIATTASAVTQAQAEFVAACKAKQAEIAAAAAADDAFVSGLVDLALGFGITRLVGVAAKHGTKLAAGKKPEFTPAIRSSEEMMDVATSMAKHDGLLGSKEAVSEAFTKAIEATGAKGKLSKALTDATASKSDLVAALSSGAGAAFRRVSESLADHTDDELIALAEGFRAVSEASYRSQLEVFLAGFHRDVASLGAYDAHYAQDFAEKLVWLRDVSTGKKRLARTRVDIPDAKEGGGGQVKNARDPKFLGWVEDDMIPFALERHHRIFGSVDDLSLAASGG